MGSNQSGGQQAPAGWYTVEGQQRYWNGTAWTEHVASSQDQKASAPTQASFGQQQQQQQPGGQAGFGQQQQQQPDTQAGFGQQQRPGAQTGFGQQPGFGQPTNQSGAQPSASDDKTLAMLAHLGGIIFGFIPSLVLWLIKKDESPFVGNHAKEALNFQISVFALLFGSFFFAIFIGILNIPLIGFFVGLLQVAVFLGNIAFCIIGGLAANKGEPYTYPVSVRLVK